MALSKVRQDVPDAVARGGFTAGNCDAGDLFLGGEAVDRILVEGEELAGVGGELFAVLGQRQISPFPVEQTLVQLAFDDMNVVCKR